MQYKHTIHKHYHIPSKFLMSEIVVQEFDEFKRELHKGDAEEEENSNILPLFFNDVDATQRYYVADNDFIIIHSCFERSKVVLRSEDEQFEKLFIKDTWPGSRVLADFLVGHSEIVRNKDILELGAGTALPSLVSLKLGARFVTITDFPTIAGLENINNLLILNKMTNAVVKPLVWGGDCAHLFEDNPHTLFDIVLMSEVLWKDTYQFHNDLLYSLDATLSCNGIGLLSFAHRTTEDYHEEHNLEFIELATNEFSFDVILLESIKKYNDVGCNDPIEVHVYKLARPQKIAISNCDT
jgi:nicotinamide N-methyltransferase